jgi:predicted DNA-binding transcriptional regulator AlpA
MMDMKNDITTVLNQMILAAVESHVHQIKDDLKKQILVENKPFLTIDDLIELTGLQKSTIYNYMSDGLITFYKVNSKKVFFRLQDIENFIFSEKHKSKLELKQEALNEYLKNKR